MNVDICGYHRTIIMKAILIGASGLVGKTLLDQLVSCNLYKEIETWVRRPSLSVDRTFTEMVLAFDELPDIPKAKADHIYCCLGTTIRKEKTKEAFRMVDVTHVVNFAKLAERSGIKNFLVISSIGANPASRNFYLRTKGEMEEKVKACSIPSIYILRPSMLLGNREERRFGEEVGKAFFKLVNPFLHGSLRKYRAVSAETVALAMIRCARESRPGIHVLESDEIQRSRQI
ncbi:MAG: NAD(P)H-binding protein [Bacteroidota bacterium]